MGKGAQFGRQMEHFGKARRALMAPHPEGENQAFAHAFHACHTALSPSFDDARIDEEETRDSLATVRSLMDSKRRAATVSERGALYDAACSLTAREREQFADAVDSLASYFDRQVFCT
jgi:hypothetical protein